MYVYLIRCESESYYKIGVTKNLSKRLNELQTSSPDKLYIVDHYESKYAFKIEKALHNLFNYLNRNNEWFNLSIEEELKFKQLCNKIEQSLILIENSQND